MAQQLRIVAAFPQVSGLIPSTHKTANDCNSSSRGFDLPFLASVETRINMVQTYMQAKHQ
ncbi:hypothetical protein I79_011101 [Cricetulus griseus]|uniref:Uncharacterized protein n=1 Tax=Cricetulus griseus TaxID=10029 RepID=G3HK83_CRIGR|nr:hypothetical protein I79_011101 [Cricetulus griseus]